MRILCLRHEHLGLIVALRRYPELRCEPVVVGGAPQLRLPVIAASRPARAAGVRPGMPLRQAQQLCPQAAFVSLDAAAAGTLRETVEAELLRLAPVVEAGDEEAFCDLSGSHAQFSDEAVWAAAAARSLQAVLGEPPAGGVASSRFTARLAAERSDPSRIRRVAPGREAAFLAPLPLAVLPVGHAVTDRLAALGLDCLGVIAALAPAALQRQFGPEGLVVARLARGDDPEPLHPAAAVRSWTERMALDGAVSDLEALGRAARCCANALGQRLAEAGLAASAAVVTLEVEDAAPVARAITAPTPVDSPDAAWAVVLGVLGELQPPGPVTAVSVELTGLLAAGGRQTDLWHAGDAAREAVLGTAARLRARFGEEAVRRARLALDPGDLPERRFLWETPALAAGRS